MSKKSNSPKRFDAPEIRNLTLDEIEFVTGGSTDVKVIVRIPVPNIRVPTIR